MGGWWGGGGGRILKTLVKIKWSLFISSFARRVHITLISAGENVLGHLSYLDERLDDLCRKQSNRKFSSIEVNLNDYNYFDPFFWQ